MNYIKSISIKEKVILLENQLKEAHKKINNLQGKLKTEDIPKYKIDE